MIYKITKQELLNLNNVFIFYFNAGPYLYLDSRSSNDDPNNVLEAYIPTSEEAENMLSDYVQFCEQIGQDQNDTLINLLTNLDVHKERLLKELDAEASEFEDNLNKDMYFTSSLGFKVNGDRRTKGNLQDLITFFDLQANDGVIDYRDYDNKLQKLTKEQLQTLLTEHVINGQNLYNQKWDKQEKIKAANSFDELHAIDLGFDMMAYDA